jgi:predicted molibdopterin-dependent oxidoreductase YjgC
VQQLAKLDFLVVQDMFLTETGTSWRTSFFR